MGFAIASMLAMGPLPPALALALKIFATLPLRFQRCDWDSERWVGAWVFLVSELWSAFVTAQIAKRAAII